MSVVRANSRTFPLTLLLMAAPSWGQAQILVHADLTRETNGVLLSWNTQPSGEYDVFTSLDFTGPWAPLPDNPRLAALNQLSLTQAVDVPKRFFQVTQRDASAPVPWNFSPPARAIGVSRRTPITISVVDDGVLDTNSMTVSITNGPPVRLTDPRLVFTDGRLTYTPAPSEVLGDFAQEVNVAISVADRSGNGLTNLTWSFQLELAPVLASDVLVVSNLAPGLVLVSTNGDLFNFAFTGDSSGLAAGDILVSSNSTFAYRRTVLAVTEDMPNHLVEVVTTNVTLADCLTQGSVQFSDTLRGASMVPPPAGPPGVLAPFRAAAVDDCCSVTFTGRTVLANANLTAEALSGFARFEPRLELRGNFGPQGLQAMDLNLGGELVVDLVLRSTGRAPGNYTNRVGLGSARKALPPDWAGPVPAQAALALKFDLVFESAWQSAGTVTAGFAATNLVSAVSQLRSGIWTNSAVRLLRLDIPRPDCATNPVAQIRVYVEVSLGIELDGVTGASLALRPTLDTRTVDSAPPGYIGCDLFLFEGLSATLAIDARSWDRETPSLSTNLLNLYQPIYHASHFFRSGPAPPPIKPVANMAWIPAGDFIMGRAQNSPLPDGPPTEVKLTEGFFIGRHEVTQHEFLAVMATNTSFHHGGVWGTNLNRPVEQVPWEDATNYCRQLTLQQRQAGRLPLTHAYRLPTEAEWEYACRAGTTGLFHYGESLRPGHANYDCSTDLPSACPTNPVLAVVAPSVALVPQPISVGSFAPNLWSLHDMHGNVAEWCLDWLGDQLPGGVVTNPRGADASLVRAIRSGSYQDPTSNCRSSSRVPMPSTTNRANLGFRIVLASAPPEWESYTITLHLGQQAIANQLQNPNSRIVDLLPAPAAGFLIVFKFNPAVGNYDHAIYDAENGFWDDPTSMTLVPGEAVVVDNNTGSPMAVTFQGQRRQVIIPVTLRQGIQFLSRQVPEPGTYETITLQDPVEGVQVHRWHPTQGVITNTFIGGIWDPAPPVADIGEGWGLVLPSIEAR